MSEPVSEPVSEPDGAGIIRASWWGTAVFAVTALGAVLASDLEVVAFGVAVTLFAAGCVIFVAAYLRAVGRSRTDQIGVINVYLLAGSAPAPVRSSLLGSLAVEVVVALGAAIARPYTSLAAGTLVPVYGLALCGLWAARHGTFPRREPPEERPRKGGRRDR